MQTTGEGCIQCPGGAGCAADVSKVQNISKIMAYKVMVTPALVIDGEVKVAGRLPRKEELHKYIKGVVVTGNQQ